MISHGEAHAGECTLSTPACHLENGKQLLTSDPKRAAEELLKSYQLDERTDTLTLYATALERDQQYALSLETWQRVIVFRESELDAAKAATKAGSSRKRAEARTAATTIQKQMDDAAEAIIRLWAKVGRVRVQIPAGKQLAVTRGGGAEVDVSKDVLVNAGRDELVFTGKDGSVARLTVEVPAGGSATVVAPEPKVAAKPAGTPAGKPAPQKITQPKPSDTETPVASQQPAEPTEPTGPRQPEITDTRTTEAPRMHTLQRVGIGLAAGSVVAIGAAVTFGILAGNDYDDSRDAGCSPDGQCPFGPAADLAERSNDRARLAQISAIGGGALLVTGVALFIVGRGKARRATTDVTLRVNPSSAAIAWRF